MLKDWWAEGEMTWIQGSKWFRILSRVPLLATPPTPPPRPSNLILSCENRIYSSDLLGSSIFSQLFMLHEEILPVSESFPDLVPFVDSLDFEGGNVLYSCDGQGTVLQHELDHFVALTEQSIIKGSVPETGRVLFFVLFCFKCWHVIQGTVKLAALHSKRKLHSKMWNILRQRYLLTPGLFPFLSEGHKTRVKLGSGALCCWTCPFLGFAHWLTNWGLWEHRITFLLLYIPNST